MPIFKKIYNIDEETNNEFYVLEAGDHLITNNAPFKNGKTIVSKCVKAKTLKLPLTVIKNYYCGVIKVNVDMDLYQLTLWLLLVQGPLHLNMDM